MTETLELRWFFKGVIKTEILQYFRDNQIAFIEENPRTDWYLLSDKLSGIKLRGTSLEFKRLTDTVKNYSIVPLITGNIERWTKLSLALQQNDDTALIERGSLPDWIAVEKTRSLAKYKISVDGIIVPVTIEERPAEACALEICSIKVFHQVWWTICFEASGTKSSLQKNMEITLKQLLKQNNLPFLKAENSFGYPQFLINLTFP